MVAEIYGRDEELARVRAFIRGTERPNAGMVLEGEAGIGKSTLWLAGVELARDEGLHVLTARTAEAERHLAYLGLSDLLEPVVDDVFRQLSSPRRTSLAVALLREEPPSGAIDPRAVGLATRDSIEVLARDRPVLIAIDDLQWFDESSMRALAFAMRRLGTDAVRLLLAQRPGATSEVSKAANVERVSLGPLSLGAMHRFLQRRLDMSIPRPAVLRVHEASGGNPFYALELALSLDSAGGLARPIALSDSLENFLAGRLRGLPASTRDALLLVAAHGRPSAQQLPMVELEPAFKAHLLEESGGVVRFTHPLLASAVYSGASTAERKKVHRTLAAAVDDPVARARHLALAANGADAAVAAKLDSAAATAYARGALLVAAELAELALRLTPPSNPEDLLSRTAAYADLLGLAGDGRRAIALLENLLKTTPPGQDRAGVLAHLARAEYDFVGLSQGVARYGEALLEAGTDDALLAEIHLALADGIKDTEDGRLALDHAELAIECASRLADQALKCKALALYSLLYSRIGLGAARRQLDEALALERALPDSQRTYAATNALVYQQIWSGDLTRARPVLERWRAELAAGEDSEENEVLWYLAMLEWRAGRWELAGRYAAQSLDVRWQFGIEGGQPIAELPSAMIAAHLGRLDEARAISLSALARAEAEGVRIAQSGHRSVLGFIELSRGEPVAALEYLRRGWEIRDSAMLFEPGHRFELADTLEALVAAGELDEAEARLGPWEERASNLDRSWALSITARCRAMVLSARGDMTAARESFDRALREHARTDDPFQHARTLLAMGVMQRRTKQRAAARASLEQALLIFERLPAPLWAGKARAELKRIGGRAPGKLDELTESERRVAELVAEGRTNQEVAASLFLGERTVASHLTHIYAKLRVRSRTELALRLR
jgi:DNA-binding CsgD family transcriptional regulator